MKLFLAFALLLAMTISFGDCYPPSSSSNHQKTHQLFVDDLNKMTKNFREGSNEVEFVSLLFDVIDRNYEMFNRIDDYMEVMNSRKVILFQISTTNGENEIFFPDSDTKIKLKQVQNSVYEKLNQIRKSILPAYNINPVFFKMMHLMTSIILIDEDMIRNFKGEVQNIIHISDEFKELFENFPIKKYIELNKEMQSVAKEFAANNVEFERAEDKLKIFLPKLYEVSIAMEEISRSATELPFENLMKATKQFRNYFKQVLEENGVQFNEKMRRMLNMN